MLGVKKYKKVYYTNFKFYKKIKNKKPCIQRHKKHPFVYTFFRDFHYSQHI